MFAPNLPERAGRVLVVEDDVAVAALLVRVLRNDGMQVAVTHDGVAALAAVTDVVPDVVLLDLHLPGRSGLEICADLKHNEATQFIPVVLMTGSADAANRLAGFVAGANDFLTKPFVPNELLARVRSLVRLKQAIDELDSTANLIESLALTVEARDAGTDGHCQRLARYATALGASCGLGARDLQALHRGGYLHDVGKIGIPDAILLKPGRLTLDEFAIMKEHTIIGERLCGGLRSLALVRPIVRHHHERLDGSGYPDGLVGKEIPLTAQIVSVVDGYDAMTSHRPYRAAQSTAYACQELRDDVRRGLLDSDLVATFIALVEGNALAG